MIPNKKIIFVMLIIFELEICKKKVTAIFK